MLKQWSHADIWRNYYTVTSDLCESTRYCSHIMRNLPRISTFSLFSCRGLAAMDVVSFSQFSWVQAQAYLDVALIFSLMLSSVLNPKYCSVNLSYNQRLLFPCLQYKIKLTPFNFLSVILFLHTSHLLLSQRCSLNKWPWVTSASFWWLFLRCCIWALIIGISICIHEPVSFSLCLYVSKLSLLPPLHFKLNSLYLWNTSKYIFFKVGKSSMNCITISTLEQ